MAVVINTNVSAMNSARLLNASTTQLNKSLARLSSGSRIVSPEDDAAGLAQSIKFDAQINRNSAANINVQNATSFSQTQDGFLQKVQKSLDRMSELSVLAQDTTKTNSDLSNYQSEFSQLQNYISNITTKQFNGVSLFDASGLGITIDSDAATFGMNSADLTGATSTGVLNAYSGVSISTSTSAYSALNQIKTAIQALANMRAQVGANIQRLKLTSEQLTILNENLSAANSRIKDVDVADESTQFAKYNILVQSGTAMLAQANLLPQSALRLLGG
jgi:flagellin